MTKSVVKSAWLASRLCFVSVLPPASRHFCNFFKLPTLAVVLFNFLGAVLQWFFFFIFVFCLLYLWAFSFYLFFPLAVSSAVKIKNIKALRTRYTTSQTCMSQSHNPKYSPINPYHFPVLRNFLLWESL